ncbi:MAG: hydrogenase formation protein HypD [Bacteroidales bacterium]
MELSEGFRERGRVDKLVRQIRQESAGEYFFMEVCGGHTTAIQGFGIPKLIPGSIRLISGPGCPVCVTARSYIDHAIALSGDSGIVIATFGDLLRVPGSRTSLEKVKAEGAAINIVYSVNEAVSLAEKNRSKTVVFLAIGFETTAPGTAAGVLKAEQLKTDNFLILSAHKIMPPAMRAVVEGGTNVNGFICPGHVSTVTGSGIYGFLPRDYGIGCVIAGFEPVDILQSVLMLIRQVNSRKPYVEVQYTRAVKPGGNRKAVSVMEQVFSVSDDWWRGFGQIPGSGLQLKARYKRFDARRVMPAFAEENTDDGACICGEILRGRSSPPNCPLFGSVCTPGNPSGACMVSAEGACYVHYKFRTHA